MADSISELLEIVDVDDLGDIASLFTILLDRPVEVSEWWDDEPDLPDDLREPALEVLVHGDDGGIGGHFTFPVNLLEMAWSAGENAGYLGAYRWEDDDAGRDEGIDLTALSEEELIAALQQALGRVRLLALMDQGGDAE